MLANATMRAQGNPGKQGVPEWQASWHAKSPEKPNGVVLLPEPEGKPHSVTTFGRDTAWRLFTKRIDRETAKDRFPDIRIAGDAGLAGKVLEMVSIMA
jgi:hypothetical protein